MTVISQYYANVGINVDKNSIKDVDKFLSKIESKLKSAAGKKGMEINVRIDEQKFHKHLQGVMNRAGKSSPLKLTNITIDPSKIIAGVNATLARSQFRAPITAVLSRASVANIRSQLQAALQNITIGARIGSARAPGGSTGASGGTGRGSVAAARRASLTGRGDPSVTEFLMGKPDKSSLSAGNRRYLDAIVKQGTGGFLGNGLPGQIAQAGIGGLARVGGSTAIGRGAMSLGVAGLGPVGGVVAGVLSSILPAATGVFKGIWTAFGTMVTAPFRLLSGVVSSVTGAFYQLVQTMLPAILAFGLVNKNVQETKQRSVAINTVAGRFGSTGEAESRWLMNMANTSGMRYSSVIDPFTSFVGAAAPSLGLGGAKGIFEAFMQYGSTHGATDESTQRAMLALSQMAGKGQIMSEELKNQLAEARGYSGMMQIFAEANQMSMGRTGSSVKTGQAALQEMLEMMKKGQVMSAKILPYVEEIAKKTAAPGIAEASTSSFAEQNRFMNQISEFWKNFSGGGGESGLAFFWTMMQRVGTWFQDNGANLGRHFESLMIHLDTLRLGIYEFTTFLSTGQANSFSDMLAEYGINLNAMRDAMLRIFEEIGNIFGIGRGGMADTLQGRIQNFSVVLTGIMNAVADMLSNIAQYLDAYRAWKNSPMFSLEGMKAGFNMVGQVGGFTSNLTSATGGALQSMTDLAGVTSYTPSRYAMQGNNRGGFGESSTPLSSLQSSLPSNLQTSTNNHKVDVVIRAEGNPEMLDMFVTTKLRNEVEAGINRAITSSLVDAPKN